MNYSISFSIFLLFIFLFQGCLNVSESDYEREVREADEYMEQYISTNDIDAEKQDTGVYIETIKENEDGKQIVEDHVVGILYTMTHMEGDYVVESYSDTLNPLRFKYSYGPNFNTVHPAGLNYEVGKMRQGETFRFYIPSYLAFGSFGHEDFFDAYSHFILEVDLIEVKTEEEIYEEELEIIKGYIAEHQIGAESYPNGLYHVVVEEGDGQTPSGNSQVRFHFTRRYLDGTVIETSENGDPIQVYLNDNRLVPGLEEGIRLMHAGEKAQLIMPSKIAFGESLQIIPQKLREFWVEEEEIYPLTKPYSPVVYDVELLQIF